MWCIHTPQSTHLPCESPHEAGYRRAILRRVSSPAPLGCILSTSCRANNADGLHAGEMALMWVQLADMGYVPISREDNIYCAHCSEFAVMRTFC